MSDYQRWYMADADALASQVFGYVQEVEREQSALFERFFRLGCLYDPYYAMLSGDAPDDGEWRDRNVHENVIAQNVDTVVALIASARVRPRVLLDDGTWDEQRTAARLSMYAEGVAKLIGAHELAVEAFRDAALKGTGLVKVFIDWASGDICAERVMVDDIVVDERECRTGAPRQMHHRQIVDRDVLAARFPAHAREIRESMKGATGGFTWAGYRPIERSQVVVVESWHLPIGRKGRSGYRAGRHSLCIDGAVLYDDREWEKTSFPFARMTWASRSTGWYGIGGAERIAGHQRRINKSQWQIDRQNDQLAVPTTYVHLADANLAVKTTNKLGTIAVYKNQIPKTVIPNAVSPETYARLDRVREGAFEEFGVSRLAATSKKPGGLDSGAALREYRDQTTQRFARQEEAFERLVLDVIWLAIDCAKELAHEPGYEPPTVSSKRRRGRRRLRWGDVDVGAVRIQLQAASTLSRTPAGRTQMVLEWAQAGIISQDEARRLLAPFDPLDLDRALSLYTAALDDIDLTIEQLLDGEVVVPEPFQNLQLGVWRCQQAYLIARDEGAPDEILENVRRWIVQAAHVLALAEQPSQAPASAQPVSQLAAEAPLAGV